MMTLKKTLLTAALLATTAASAQAADLVSSELTLGYGSVSSDAAGVPDMDGTFGKGAMTLDFGGFDADLSAAYGGLGNDDTATVLSAAPSLEVAPGMKIGGFFDYTMSSVDDDNAMHYGVTGEYAMQDLTASGYAGLGDYDNAAIGESTVYGAALNYDLPGAFDAGVFYDAENTDAADTTRMGVRAGYDLTAFSVPVYASASLAQVDNGTNDSTVMGFSLSIPLGGSGSVDKGDKRFHDRSLYKQASFLSN